MSDIDKFHAQYVQISAWKISKSPIMVHNLMFLQIIELDFLKNSKHLILQNFGHYPQNEII